LIGSWVVPNHITGLRLIVGIAACGLLSLGSPAGTAWSGVLWIVTCVLDRADGELARIANLRSERGKILDYYSDMILDSGWFLGAGIGLRHGHLGQMALALGVLTCACLIASIVFAEMFEKLSPPGVKAWHGVRRFHPDDGLFLLAPLSWFGWVQWVLIGASLCTPVIAVLMFVRYVALKRRAAKA
jgi:phosphatidylglycerophosphate synthase